jgi:energy-coupling factor transporter ATP-binding protein EcfA2
MKSTDQKSPEHLLEKSRSERVNEFKKCWAGHRKIAEARDQVMRYIREPANVVVIHLVGPTGVGKSTLLRHILKKVNEDALPEMEKRPGWIPAAYMLAENPQNGVYNWTEHFKQTMEALNEVLIERKIDVPDPGATQGNLDGVITRGRQPPHVYRRAAEKSLRGRECNVFIIDDAHYILKRRSGEQIINQADTIKSVAEQSGTLHLLAGTYDLLPLRNLNGQHGRISVTVRFSNYKYQDSEDVNSFIGVLKFFMSKLPLAQKPDFKEHWEFCYAMSAGCVGVLKDWFVRSLDVAISENKGVMTFELFKSCKPPTSVISKIAEEISMGEEKLEKDESDDAYSTLNKLLGMGDNRLPSEHNAVVTDKANQSFDTGSLTGDITNNGKKKRGKIETKPRRHPVGLNDDSL